MGARHRPTPPLTAWSTPTPPCHHGLRAGFIEQDQRRRIDCRDLVPPPLAVRVQGRIGLRRDLGTQCGFVRQRNLERRTRRSTGSERAVEATRARPALTTAGTDAKMVLDLTC